MTPLRHNCSSIEIDLLNSLYTGDIYIVSKKENFTCARKTNFDFIKHDIPYL